MKKVLATLMFIMCLAAVGSSQVVSVYKDEYGLEYFVDKSSIHKEDNLTIFVSIVKGPPGVILTAFGTDCKTYVVLTNKVITDEVTITHDFKKLKPLPIVQGSKVAYVMNYVCKPATTPPVGNNELIGLLAGNYELH